MSSGRGPDLAQPSSREEPAVRRKGVTLCEKGAPLLSKSLNSLRESLLESAARGKAEPKQPGREKESEQGSSLLQSQSLQTNMTVLHSNQSTHTLLTQSSGLADKNKVSRSMEPQVRPARAERGGRLLASAEFKEDGAGLGEEGGERPERAPAKGGKRVHFAEPDILSKSSRLPTSDSDSDGEVWFNNTTRTTLLTTFFADEENIMEFLVTIYALVKYFNKSDYQVLIRQLSEPERALLEPEISKITDELITQVSQNRLDNNMAESNYLIVIQRDLEDTQIRLGETERLLKKQQKEHTDLEIEANHLLRLFEGAQAELGVMRRIHDLMQEELEAGGARMEDLGWADQRRGAAAEEEQRQDEAPNRGHAQGRDGNAEEGARAGPAGQKGQGPGGTPLPQKGARPEGQGRAREARAGKRKPGGLPPAVPRPAARGGGRRARSGGPEGDRAGAGARARRAGAAEPGPGGPERAVDGRAGAAAREGDPPGARQPNQPAEQPPALQCAAHRVFAAEPGWADQTRCTTARWSCPRPRRSWC